MFRMLVSGALAAWLAGGLVLTLQPAHPLPGQVVEHNFVPFRTIAAYLDNFGSAFWLRQAVGNVLLLLPVGLLGPVALPWLDRWGRLLLAASAFSLIIEGVQLWVPNRSFDVDDLTLNVAGAMAGYAAYRLVAGVAAR